MARKIHSTPLVWIKSFFLYQSWHLISCFIAPPCVDYHVLYYPQRKNRIVGLPAPVIFDVIAENLLCQLIDSSQIFSKRLDIINLAAAGQCVQGNAGSIERCKTWYPLLGGSTPNVKTVSERNTSTGNGVDYPGYRAVIDNVNHIRMTFAQFFADLFYLHPGRFNHGRCAFSGVNLVAQGIKAFDYG